MSADHDTLLHRIVLPDEDGPYDLLPMYVRSPSGAEDGLSVTGRTTLTVRPGHRASFDTFFNAFPAGYYRRWTPVQSVMLDLQVRGTGRVDVYRSTGRGQLVHHTSRQVDGEEQARFELPIQGFFTDGGFYWFTVSARDELHVEGGWYAATSMQARPVSLGICTFNRPVDCLATLRTLIGDPAAVERVQKVYVVDQGDNRVDEQEGFGAVSAAWAGRLEIISQRNLGGSGGFSRAMYEVLNNKDAGDVLLMDDDILPEPESVLRAVSFATAAEGRVLVHGHMLDLWNRTRLHNTGDLLSYSDFSPRAVDHDAEDLDLTENPLAENKILHRRFDIMFGGWWMCLVPREALAALGLPLPIFVKWDDIEYGLRALENRYHTVTVPGIAVWHMPFHGKNVHGDWTAYFECRNRLLVAALYGTDKQMRKAVVSNLKAVVKAIVVMNYSAAELHHMAIDDLFAGPEYIFEDLPTVVGRVREVRKQFEDAVVLPAHPGDFDANVDAITLEGLSQIPKTALRGYLNVALGLRHALTPSRPGRLPRRADLTGHDPTWAVLSRLDEVLVATSDGAGISKRSRNQRAVRRLIARAVADHVRVMQSADELRRMYRAGLGKMTSPDRWSEIFS